jgi:hypothetical protein
VTAFQARFTWLQFAAEAVSPLGMAGGAVSEPSSRSLLVVVLDVVVGASVVVVLVVVVGASVVVVLDVVVGASVVVVLVVVVGASVVVVLVVVGASVVVVLVVDVVVGQTGVMRPAVLLIPDAFPA